MYTHLDYPPLAGYFHRYMAYIFQIFNKDNFWTSWIHWIGPHNEDTKKGVRACILVINLLFYFPAVVFVVLKNLKTLSKLHKAFIILLFLTYPTYSFVEFASTQANGPHFAFLILCLHCLINHHFILTTILFTLSLTYKQVVGPFVFPIALYMIAVTWKQRMHEKSNVSLFV